MPVIWEKLKHLEGIARGEKAILEDRIILHTDSCQIFFGKPRNRIAKPLGHEKSPD